MAVGLFITLGSLIAIVVGVIVLMYVIVPTFRGIGWLIRHLFRYVGGTIGDTLRMVGALVTMLVLAPLVVGSILIGRWSASAHYGRAIQAEGQAVALAIYRVLIGHPARLLCLNSLVDGLERRLPEVVAAAPTADGPRISSGRSGQFEGYRIIGSLPGGGSGGKLYIAEPDTMKLAIFERAGQRHVRQVVIKTFSLSDGSSLPQIVRESRALDAAKRLGLVLEHELTNERFFYVTRYVPGESLGLVTQRLHAMSGSEGLEHNQLRQAMGYAADLLRTLDEYHRGGLWHKDVKPDNIIVDATSAHLVDFGLVTPLRSAMTLTTHGTEYFRDPELVRLALKGVKVHQVDGARFDVYGAGAVLFSMIENSFPAHGGLSQIGKRCPEALRWIVRRSMTEYDKRYASAADMLHDLDYVLRSADPFAVQPFELPSMRDAEQGAFTEGSIRREPEPMPVGAGSRAAAGGVMAAAVGVIPAAIEMPAAAVASAGRRSPNLRVRSWWTGEYVADAGAPQGMGRGDGPRIPRTPWTPRNAGVPAKEQLERARARAEAARTRAHARMNERRHRRAGASGEFKAFNPGVAVALLLFAGVALAFFVLAYQMVWKRTPMHIVVNNHGKAETGTPGMTYAYGDLSMGGPAAAPAASEASVMTASVQISNSKAATPRIIINGAAVGPAPAPTLARTEFSPEVRLLAISDLHPATESVSRAMDRLRGSGATVMGNYVGNAAGPEEIEVQLVLDAQAKMIRGLSQLDDQGVTEELAEWLRSTDGLDGLVWFTRGDAKDAVRYFVFTPSADPTQPRQLELRKKLRAGVVELLTRTEAPRAGR